MFKKITSIVLALVLVLSFAGCAQSATNINNDDAKSTSATTTDKSTDINQKENEKVTNPTPTNKETNAPVNSGSDYVVNKNTKKFHKPYCRYVDDIKASNRWDYHGERSYLISKNYKPCKSCNP